MEQKLCTKCGKMKDLSEFTNDKSKKDGLYSSCKGCHNTENNSYRTKLRERGLLRPIYNEYARTRRKKIRFLVIQAYGGKCSCCGCNENRQEFLTIDHPKNDGWKNRISNFYEWLYRNKFPPEYQLLCYNCNSSFGLWGYCPHNPKIKRATYLGKKHLT